MEKTLSYEECKALKEAGFPQELYDFELAKYAYCSEEDCCGNELHLIHNDNDEGNITGNDYSHRLPTFWKLGGEERVKAKEEEIKRWVVCPSLSELIKECGEKFRSLSKRPTSDKQPYEWCADYAVFDHLKGEMVEFYEERGSYPEQAVCNLYLSLKGKKQ